MIFSKKSKNFFIFQLKFKFFSAHYLCFLKNTFGNFKNLCNRYGFHLLRIQSKYAKNLFSIQGNTFLFFNQSLIFFNDLEKFLKFLETYPQIEINFFSWMGYFLNKKYLNKISKYFLFYNENYKNFIFLIEKKSKNLSLYLFLVIFKLLILLNNVIDKKLIQ